MGNENISSQSNGKHKSNYKSLYERLKKMTVITIIVCVLILLSIPVLLFIKSKYKLVKTETTETKKEEEVKDIF